MGDVQRARSQELCGSLCFSLTLLQKTSLLQTELGGPGLQQPEALTMLYIQKGGQSGGRERGEGKREAASAWVGFSPVSPEDVHPHGDHLRLPNSPLLHLLKAGLILQQSTVLEITSRTRVRFLKRFYVFVF